MSAQQLWETTLDPINRQLLRVRIDNDRKGLTEKKINLLMSKTESLARKKWMQEKGNNASIDVLNKYAKQRKNNLTLNLSVASVENFMMFPFKFCEKAYLITLYQ